MPIVPDFTLDADDGGVAHHQAEYAKHYEDHEYEYEHCALTPLEFSTIDGFRLGLGAGLAGLILQCSTTRSRYEYTTGLVVNQMAPGDTTVDTGGEFIKPAFLQVVHSEKIKEFRHSG